MQSTPTADGYSLPARYYTDAAIYAREKEQIFYRSWNFAGYLSQLREPGDYITCRVADERLIVIRGADRTLRAFYNVCRHRAHELLQGAGRVQSIVCPYHAWTYETDGSLRFARNRDCVVGFERDAFRLEPVQVEALCGFVFVNLDPAAARLAELVPGFVEEITRYEPRFDRLHLVHRQEYTIASNWKNLVDNYNENYHTPMVHPVLADILEFDTYRIGTHGLYINHRSGTNRGVQGGFDVEGENYQQHLNWWLWPNLCPMSFPGGGFRMLHIMPNGPEETHETYDFYLPDEHPSAARMEQISFAADVVNREDIAPCESMQRGLHSRGFTRSRVMLDRDRGAFSEHAVSHFKNLVLDALGDNAVSGLTYQ